MITKTNIEKLQGLIKQVSSMINWVSDNTQSSKRVELMNKLVNARRHLKRIYNAMVDNPTVAAYGESQQGKSYIISSLLSSPGHPLKVLNDEGERVVDFIDNINYVSDNQESTGVITRFTTSNSIIDKNYPVKLHLFSLADVVTILADSFMVDIQGYTPYSETDLKGIVERIIEKYGDSANVQSVFTEDEIGDICDFISKHNQKFGSVYINSGYFNVLSTIIRRVPESQWVEVFGPLWKNNVDYNKLFSLVASVYSQLHYSSDVYTSIKTVLNDGNDGSETLMCVKVLAGLSDVLIDGAHSGVQVKVMLPNRSLVSINKSLLSALTAEVVYNIDSTILNEKKEFIMEGVREGDGISVEEVINILKQNSFHKDFTKSFLDEVDLLDFPGARGRDLKYEPSQIVKQLGDKLFLRCKVSYLFTKYCEDLKLSILMFCHSQRNETPNLVAPILEDWVHTYVGDTAEKRARSLANYDVPPLFIVSTMFNMDLSIQTGKQIDRMVFKRRLDLLYDRIIDHASRKWFDSWTNEHAFNNTFLLRDYYWSSTGNKCSGLFKGYPNSECEECDIEARIILKKTFLNEPIVKTFFQNPELSWDAASTMGNDGSYYMLKRLADASLRAAHAREIQFNEDMKTIFEQVMALMKGEFHEDNDTELLEQGVRNARKFDYMLRRACEKQNDFFGRMIQFLQINSNFVASYFNKIIRSNSLVASSDVKEYEMLIRGVEEQGYQFDPSPSAEAIQANFKILDEVYGITGADDPMMKGIDPVTLFQSTYKKRCTPSTVLANALIEYWKNALLRPESSVVFTQAGFDGLVFSNFITNFTNMMIKVNLAQHIADAIKEYVDFSAAIAPQNEELVADIATDIYNAFVMNLGYTFLDDTKKQNNALVAEKYKLPKIQTNETIEQSALNGEEQLQHLFSQLEALNEGEGGQLIQLPAYINMRRWMSFVFMSFTVAYDIVQYDEIANKQLGTILNDFANKKQYIG